MISYNHKEVTSRYKRILVEGASCNNCALITGGDPSCFVGAANTDDYLKVGCEEEGDSYIFIKYPLSETLKKL